tara:strand:- start:311 stop:517 length:207 start_codon:yes stop_codon:yes gene_type:complete
MFKIELESDEIHTVIEALKSWNNEEGKDLLQFLQEEVYMHYKYPDDWCGEEEVQDTERKLCHFDPLID